MIKKTIRNLHLGISATIVFGVALIYGANPDEILPLIFDFGVESTELKNVFRAITSLYI